MLEDRTAPALFNVQAPLSYGTGVMNNNGCVAVADLDKNGFPDAIFTNYGNWDAETNPNGTTGTTITVLYRQNATTFSGPLTLSTGGQTVSFVTVGDINGDTYPDVVAVNSNKQSTGSVSVFKNDGAGNLSLVAGSPFSAAGNNTSWVGLTDVTGDTILDIVCGSFGKIEGTGDDATITGANITIFQGNATEGKGNFTYAATPITLPNPAIIQFVPTALAVEDFDGDGNKDIAAVVPGVPPDFGQPYPNGTVYVFKGTGSGGFAAPNQYDTGGTFPVNIQAADVNGDSKPDLVVANAGDPRALSEFAGSSVGVILNVSSTGNPTFGVTNSLNANCYGTFAVSVADFDLDGKKDIAAVNYGRYLALSPDAFVSVYIGKGNGTFDPGSPGSYDTQTGDGGGQYLAPADFDGNGTPDLIVAHSNNRVGVMINTTVAGAATTTALASSQNPSTAGDPVTFTATVSAQSGTPAGGTVTFFRNGVQIGSPVNLSNQQAQLTTSSLPTGTGSITATYSGAAGFAGSTSNTVSQVVNAAPANPTVTINQANGQADPTNGSSVAFTVKFSEAVTGFDGSDIAFTGSTVGGTLVAGVTGSGQDYTVSVTGMTGQGDVVVAIPAGAAVNGGGTASAASTTTDNKVRFDAVAPAVTIDQAAGQADPTGTPSVKFDVKFSEPVTGFDKADVSLTGSTAGGTLTADVTGSGATYTVTVTGMTTGGTVVASVPAGGATDGLNSSLASTSTDNSVTFVETGTVAFSKATFTGTEDAGFVEITVTRSGPLNGALTVDYSTKDGTAHTGGSLTAGQADYTPVTTPGTLTWGDGLGGSQTIKIPIADDKLNEGTELFTVKLSNPTGGSLGLADTATAAIAPSDGRLIDAKAKVPAATFFEALGVAGDKVTVRLAGLKGTATVYLTDPDGNGVGQIEWIDLDGTDPFVSKLYVTAVKPRGWQGDGRSELGEVSGDGVRAIIAPKTDLNGTDVHLDGITGVHLDGFLRRLVIGNISGEADITVGAPPPTILTPVTRIQAGVIGDGTDITLPARLYNLLAVSIGDGTITAPSAGVIAARGKAATLLAPAIPGNFKSDVFISGLGVAPTAPALGKLRAAANLTADTVNVGGNLGTVSVGSLGAGNMTGTDFTVAGNLNYFLVAGTVNQVTVNVQGNVLSVLVGSFWNSRLDAGYEDGGPDDGSGTYDRPSVIGSFRVRGALNGFQSSNVIATTINSVVLGSVNPDNNGTRFGVTADRALKALRVTNPVQFWVFNPQAASPQTGPALGDFLAEDRNGPLP